MIKNILLLTLTILLGITSYLYLNEKKEKETIENLLSISNGIGLSNQNEYNKALINCSFGRNNLKVFNNFADSLHYYSQLSYNSLYDKTNIPSKTYKKFCLNIKQLSNKSLGDQSYESRFIPFIDSIMSNNKKYLSDNNIATETQIRLLENELYELVQNSQSFGDLFGEIEKCISNYEIRKKKSSIKVYLN